KQGLHLLDRRSELVHASEHRRNLRDSPPLRYRWDLQDFRNLKLRGAVLNVFVEDVRENTSSICPVLLKEVLLFASQHLGSLSARSKGRVIGKVAEQVEGIRVRLLRGLGKLVE